ncbi:hypothetical protein ABT126_04000 [Streptomyces sp. NPDC002012]|uniref:hypothetical protein n=1 Tax=unclassified Streptomyces TaxID=2593676 RepID=UPI003327457A
MDGENGRPPGRAAIGHHITAVQRVGPREDRNLYAEVADGPRNAPGHPDVPPIVLTVLGHDDTQAQL